MPLNLEQDETLTDASAALMAAEANLPEIPKEAFEQSENGELQQTEASQGDDGKQPSKSEQTDTLATADTKLKDAEATDKTQEQQTPKAEAKTGDDKGKSKFSNNTERLDKTWKAVNERKVQLDAREQQINQQVAALKLQEQKIQLEAAKAKQKFTPEQYEQAAQNKLNSITSFDLQAKGLDKQAEEFEANGEYGKAELARKQAQDMRDQINGERYSAKQLREMADNLRKNPDPTIAQHKATMEQHKRHYLLEAAKVWPDLAKEGSEFQKQMAGHLQAIAKQGIDPEENPVVFYHVARLTAAEAAAARVPDLVKKLGVAEAKVKELEALVAPGGGQGSVQRQSGKTDMSVEEEEAELRQEAQARS